MLFPPKWESASKFYVLWVQPDFPRRPSFSLKLDQEITVWIGTRNGSKPALVFVVSLDDSDVITDAHERTTIPFLLIFQPAGNGGMELAP